MPETVSSLRARAVRRLRKLATLAADAPERTAINRELAETFVDLREHFITDTGEPDWRGATHRYKAAVGDIYSAAGYGREAQRQASAAIRHHVGVVLRTRLSKEELEDIGILKSSPAERVTRKRRQDRAILAAVQMRSLDPLRAIMAAAEILRRVGERDIAGMTPVEARAAIERVGDLVEECKRLEAALRARRPGKE